MKGGNVFPQICVIPRVNVYIRISSSGYNLAEDFIAIKIFSSNYMLTGSVARHEGWLVKIRKNHRWIPATFASGWRISGMRHFCVTSAFSWWPKYVLFWWRNELENNLQENPQPCTSIQCGLIRMGYRKHRITCDRRIACVNNDTLLEKSKCRQHRRKFMFLNNRLLKVRYKRRDSATACNK